MRRSIALLTGLLVALIAAPAPALAAPAFPPIKHVWVIMLENKNYATTFGADAQAPYLSSVLPTRGALLPNYYGVTHESLGNYIALISGQGSNLATQSDCQFFVPVLPGTVRADGQALGAGCLYPARVKTVADQLTTAGRTWRGYMQDMPAPCTHPAIGSRDGTQSAKPGAQYAARHNPFVYFRSLIDSPACGRNDVPLTRLTSDLRSAGASPSFSLITPDLCEDGHDAPCVDGRPGGLVSADAFLRRTVPQITGSPAYRNGGLLLVTFDEAEGLGANADSGACCGEPQFPNTTSNGFLVPGRGGGQVGLVALSPYIDPGTLDNAPANHFSLLRSVEDLYGLGHLGYAGSPGVPTFGRDLFTCYDPSKPKRVRKGVYRRGALIRKATLSKGTAKAPTLEVRLRHRARLTVYGGPSGKRAKLRRLGGGSPAPCAPRFFRLRSAHGRIEVRAAIGRNREVRRFAF